MSPAGRPAYNPPAACHQRQASSEKGGGDDRSDRQRLHGRQGSLRRSRRGHRRGARAPCGGADLAALLAGRRRRGLREVRHRPRGRPRGDGQLPRQGAHAGRTALRRFAGALADSRNPSLQPPRVLRRVRRQARRARRGRPRALRRLDRLGQGARHRARLQPDLLLASEGRRQHHALSRRSRRSGRSGSTTASPAGASAPRWAKRSASPASPTSGSPTG